MARLKSVFEVVPVASAQGAMASPVVVALAQASGANPKTVTVVADATTLIAGLRRNRPDILFVLPAALPDLKLMPRHKTSQRVVSLKLPGSKRASTNRQTTRTERPASFATLRKGFAPQDEGLEQATDLTEFPATNPRAEEQNPCAASRTMGVCARANWQMWHPRPCASASGHANLPEDARH